MKIPHRDLQHLTPFRVPESSARQAEIHASKERVRLRLRRLLDLSVPTGTKEEAAR